MESLLDEFLVKIDKKITRLEEKDPNFRENPKWIEMRKQQDDAFKKLAMRKLSYHERIYNQTQDPKNEKFIKIYKDYIGENCEKSNWFVNWGQKCWYKL